MNDIGESLGYSFPSRDSFRIDFACFDSLCPVSPLTLARSATAPPKDRGQTVVHP
jgi:hypothetical protein